MKYIFISGALFLLLGSSCYYDKFEHYKPSAACDTATVISYADKVKPILEAQCYSCHSGTAPSGVISLDSYASAKASAQTGKLLSSITWDGNASKMPKGAYDQIDNCSINTIKNWISSNYQQ